MKRIFLLLCTIALCFSANRSQAQSYLTFINIYDSSGVSHCTVSSPALYRLAIFSSLDFSGLELTIHVEFGDGNDTIVYGILPGFEPLVMVVPHTFTSAGAYYQHCVAWLSNGYIDSVDSEFPTLINDSCRNVSGIIYYDQNQNCIYDSTDVATYTSIHVKSAIDTLAQDYTYDNGMFSFDLPATGNYTLEMTDLSLLGLAPLCPNSWDFNFTTDSGDVQQNFSLTCAATEPDNQLQNVWLTGGLPGDYVYLTAILENINCFPGAGTLTFELDSIHEYIGVYVNGSNDSVPVSVNGNIITFNFSGLVTFNNNWNQYIESVQTLVSPNSLPGDSSCIIVTITPNDLNNSNNVKHLCGVIGGPFDPNHKRVSPLGTGEDAIVPPGTELTYTVEFQNTGNAPAINVILRDTLDTDFDLSTLQVTGSSHPMTYALNQNALDFSFQNIMLPDSGSDETASHGWVTYKIKPNTSAPLGTVVTNTASIYFDNNAPVLTNKTRNTFDNSTGITSPITRENLFAFPNPARDEIQFSLPENFRGDVEIRNMIGNLIWFHHVESSNFKLATNQFASGIYQMVARSGAHSYSLKFAVMK